MKRFVPNLRSFRCRAQAAARFLFIFFCGLICQIPFALAQIHLVAAENFYGEVAQELGGDSVSVTNILKSPKQDPHLFSASPTIAKAVAEADIVVYNGANYDDWMVRLLSISGKKERITLTVADLVGVKVGENPHIWYMPNTMSYYAKTLSQHFSALDPAHKNEYAVRLAQFEVKQKAFQDQVQQLKKRISGLSVTATEPVFNRMTEALGLKMRNLAFQWSLENEGSPSPSSVKAMLDDLNQHQVRVLFYNTQVTSPLADQIKTVAGKNHIPIVGVSETQPSGLTYHQWMQQQLQSLADALTS